MIGALVSAPESPASSIFAITSAVSIVATVAGALFAWFKLRPELRKLRSETNKVDVDAALAVEERDDEHWREIVTTQTEAIVQPLRAEVERLSREVASLRTEVETFRTRYWRAITYIRMLLAWNGRSGSVEAVPIAPSEIAGDI